MVHWSVTSVCSDRLRGLGFVLSQNVPLAILFQQVSTAQQAVISLASPNQKFGTKMHQNAFGGQAMTGPFGGEGLERSLRPSVREAGRKPPMG